MNYSNSIQTERLPNRSVCIESLPNRSVGIESLTICGSVSPELLGTSGYTKSQITTHESHRSFDQPQNSGGDTCLPFDPDKLFLWVAADGGLRFYYLPLDCGGELSWEQFDLSGPLPQLPTLTNDGSPAHSSFETAIASPANNSCSNITCTLPNDASQQAFLDFEPDLNYDYNNNIESLFHPEFFSLPDLPPPEESVDFDQAYSSPETSAWSGSSRPTISPSKALSTPPSPFVPAISPSPSNATKVSASSTFMEQSASSRQANEVPKPVAISRAWGRTCLKCSKIFSSQILLDRHYQHHKEFVCTKGCGVICKSKKDLQRHDDYKHGDKNPTCRICGYRARKDGLKRHMKVHEQSANPKHGKRKRSQEVKRSQCKKTKMESVDRFDADYS